MRDRQTRRPTGMPAWPLILLSGVEGGGKSWCAVEATGLPFVHRAFYLELGERMADEYGSVPGANYEIVPHNGTFNDFLEAAQWAASQPAPEGTANMLIVDSISAVWELLSDEAQHRANQRGRGRKNADGDRQITMDLWNDAKDRYYSFMQVLRAFAGPVILTARLDFTTIVTDGNPTGEKIWKPRGHKNLPFDVQVVMQARTPQKWTMTKIASTRFQLPPGGEMEIPDFTIGLLLEKMGIDCHAKKAEFIRPSPVNIPALPADVERVARDLMQAGDIQRMRSLWEACKAHGREDLAQIVSELAKAHAEQRQQSVKESPKTPSEESVEQVLEGELVS